MRSATSSEGPRLFRIALPCAQTRVTIEMHSLTNISTNPSHSLILIIYDSIYPSALICASELSDSLW